MGQSPSQSVQAAARAYTYTAKAKAYGPTGLRAYGPMGLRAYGPTGLRAYGYTCTLNLNQVADAIRPTSVPVSWANRTTC